jgi:transcriptional regulator NrdR family protein
VKCPKCEEKTKVTDSRLSLSGKEVLRVRTCPNCFYTFKTMEWEDDSEDMEEEWRAIHRILNQRNT